jgi:hypothetical protein
MTVRAFALAAVVLIAAGPAALAKDRSMTHVAPRNPAEACCVETALLPPIETSSASDATAMLGVNQIAPTSEAKPGLDGADWNCRRPDGSRRCFSSLRNR